MQIKQELFQKNAAKLKRIIHKALCNQQFEKALAAISAYSSLCYEWNQFYTDDEIEKSVSDIAGELLQQSGCELGENGSYDNRKVLFYDGFGLDTRGLALIYLKALSDLGYEILYVTISSSKGKQPEIEKIVESVGGSFCYFDNDSYINHFTSLLNAFNDFSPGIAFLYTLPDDASAVAVFSLFDKMVKRYQINLTDQAYWLGKCAFDICLEFREYGSNVSVFHRGIDKDSIRILPFYPWVDSSIDFEGFDFDTRGKKIIFSGGALYKTLGGENKFYALIEQILKKRSDTLFLYAGSGDDAQLRLLSGRNPGRVIHIAERKDLFALLQNVDIYINTYPITGGLMTQYAAMAGKVPFILNDTHDPDAGEMLIDQEHLNIEFDNIEDIVNEVDKMLNDEQYYSARAERIKKSVISECEFIKRLKEILNGEATCPDNFSKPDTDILTKTYKDRFSEKSVVSSIMQKKRKAILSSFPLLLMKKLFYKLTGQ